MKRIISFALAVCLMCSCAYAGTWTCGICQFENEADNMFCGTCGAERTGWICSNCGVLNDEDAAYCKACGLSRDQERVWTCVECGTINDGKFCSECGHGKDEVITWIYTPVTGEEIVGEIVNYGYYGGENVKWRVLENDGQSVCLISENALEAKAYHEAGGEVSWENCSLRAWLNNDFLYSAFSDEERNHLCIFTELNDSVSLLSVDDVMTYFNVNGYENEYSEYLVCMPTQHASEDGAWTMKEENVNEWQVNYDYEIRVGACWWWLRYTDGSRNSAPTVGSCGDVSYSGGEVYHESGAVRPIIRVSF